MCEEDLKAPEVGEPMQIQLVNDFWVDGTVESLSPDGVWFYIKSRSGGIYARRMPVKRDWRRPSEQSVCRRLPLLTIEVGTNLEEVKRRLVASTLARVGGDKKLTAQLLGVSLRTLCRLMKQMTAEEIDHG